nr:hypothetical protein [Coprococcus eutactus]
MGVENGRVRIASIGWCQLYVLDPVLTGEYLNPGDEALVVSGSVHKHVVFRVWLVFARLQTVGDIGGGKLFVDDDTIFIGDKFL